MRTPQRVLLSVLGCCAVIAIAGLVHDEPIDCSVAKGEVSADGLAPSCGDDKKKSVADLQESPSCGDDKKKSVA